ncbi:aspartate kinase [uncultured Albimonas sp.]|uniref:aspartate kinase n=1 Tax=uncultured Albimonas sp. TaxID=1331701 RepID=UPI0030EE0030
MTCNDNAPLREHTVEKIGGTSMSRTCELLDGLFIGDREEDALYNRVFVVSAYSGITNLLLEHKKSGEPGVYALFANADHDHGWSDGLNRVMKAMTDAHHEILDDKADVRAADDFVRERIEGARSVLIDLQRLCSYGHFQLDSHLLTVRELISGLGEAHSAFVTATLLRRHGVNARFVDLTGWRDETHPSLDQRIDLGFEDIDLARELPIVTGYAQCREGLMREFDRGYSEVTFSRIAARTRAREAIVHKEFHLSSADPKVVGADAVRKLGRTNYDVADQLSNLGMEAIHPRAAKTLRQAGIPLRVTNAFEPDDPGTLIDAEYGGETRVEMVTGLPVLALEVFEQDMVGVKGYDARILESLTRHRVRIVSKSSNANTITHYVDASLKLVKRVEADLAETCPGARVRARKMALVSAIGRNLEGLSVARRGLTALEARQVKVLAVQDNGRAVDVQWLVPAEQADDAVRALHEELVSSAEEIARPELDAEPLQTTAASLRAA